MGRRIPTPSDLHYYCHQNQTSTLSLSLLLIAMAATLSFTTILCGVRFRRKRKPEPNEESSVRNPEESSSSKEKNADKEASEKEDNETKELPLPPAKQARSMDPFPGNINLPSASSTSNAGGGSLDQYITKSASLRNFKSAISLKVPRSLSVARTITSFRDKATEKKGGGKEDSVWTKTIILGEKCKVPDEEDDEVVVRDGKGNRVSAYHPRSSSLLPSKFRDDQSSVSDQGSGSGSDNVNGHEAP